MKFDGAALEEALTAAEEALDVEESGNTESPPVSNQQPAVARGDGTEGDSGTY